MRARPQRRAHPLPHVRGEERHQEAPRPHVLGHDPGRAAQATRLLVLGVAPVVLRPPRCDFDRKLVARQEPADWVAQVRQHRCGLGRQHAQHAEVVVAGQECAARLECVDGQMAPGVGAQAWRRRARFQEAVVEGAARGARDVEKVGQVVRVAGVDRRRLRVVAAEVRVGQRRAPPMRAAVRLAGAGGRGGSGADVHAAAGDQHQQQQRSY
eukprot:364646-Chlamydomonas_euryale.AAC.1